MTCEECVDHGALTGGIIDIEPAVPCLGDVLTFTLSGVVNTGGIKRVDCYAKTAVPGAAVTYAWRITRPDQTVLTGTGAVATVVVERPGNYSCTFTATAERECPPAPRTIGPVSEPVNVTATLTLDPTFIPAYTAWPGPNYAYADLTVQWDPPECEGTLEIVAVEPQGAYTPADGGSVVHLGANHWRYLAFTEPASEKCPDPVKVWIAAVAGGMEVSSRRSILVLPVHT